MESIKKPLISSGNIAVWPAKELNNGKKVYGVTFENVEDRQNYISVFANIAGYELKPDEVLALALGKDVRIEDEGQYGPRTCTIVNRSNLTKINEKEGKSYENTHMVLGAAFHKVDENGKTFCYSCNGVSFFSDSGDQQNDRNMFLTPQDCFKLLDGCTVSKDGCEAFIRKITETKNVSEDDDATTEEKIYRTARLDIKKVNNRFNYHLRGDTTLNEEDHAMKL